MEEAVNDVNISNAKLTWSAREILRNILLNCLKIEEQEYAASPTDETISTIRYCPTVFDGFACWNKTPAGTTVWQKCPNFLEGFNPKQLAFKRCKPDGTWFVHPESNKTWSNYTTCVDTDDLRFREFINDLYVIGYTVSLLTLLISLFIFYCFRRLKCTRIRIHVQLFLSLILSCILWICWYKFVVDVPEIIIGNPTWCVILHLFIHYFMLSNYMWMFCEGLHLHLVLVVVFVKDNVALKWFYTIGWGIPLCVMTIYTYMRSHSNDDTDNCWMHESEYIWILTIPVTISLFASVLFLINVIKVLLTKLHPCTGHTTPVGIRKAARATCILVPLFGLQNVLLPLRPDPGSFIEPYYQVIAAILISLQGFCVSVLFCFVNHDVIFEIRAYLCRTFPDIFHHVRRETSNNVVLTIDKRTSM
ncbi:calcitonin gene-related peptide type 1 receptor [Culicoides brevitarsis]|uniref:calcitonin gene-related peptide type 1 receptor n=1 Tax=Culicoides brevitarsis TaxID=469753 RepID=UPI00307C78EC